RGQGVDRHFAVEPVLDPFVGTAPCHFREHRLSLFRAEQLSRHIRQRAGILWRSVPAPESSTCSRLAMSASPPVSSLISRLIDGDRLQQRAGRPSAMDARSRLTYSTSWLPGSRLGATKNWVFLTATSPRSISCGPWPWFRTITIRRS